MRLLRASAVVLCHAATLVQALRLPVPGTVRRFAAARAKMATFASSTTSSSPPPASCNFSWQQTMLRIKDPKVTVPFFQSHFGFTLIHTYHFPQWNFSLYFLAVLPAGQTYDLVPGTKEAEDFLWRTDLTTLELTHNHGSEVDDAFAVNNGNVEPHRGFGHVAVMTSDVYAACVELEAAGVRFQKRPDEGRMKGLAFCLSPEGYWIEIVKRGEAAEARAQGRKYTFAQTMLRVKDPAQSLRFYRDLLGMTLVAESHYSDFSLYFLACANQNPVLADALSQGTLPAPTSPEANEFIKNMFGPVLELTHNHGTEGQATFRYHNGNDQDQGQLRGFGHTGFLVDDLDAACAWLETQGVAFKKKPLEGTMRGLAFAYDSPGDQYWVELIQRGAIDLVSQSTPPAGP